jgi:AraC-like DNA-binding protein
VTIDAWHSPIGLVEEYEYPPGPAGVVPMHAHYEMQICFSLDFPGRYAYRGRVHDVPIGAVSVLDSWEPHAASDPFDRDRPSHYIVLYVDPASFKGTLDLPSRDVIDDPIRTAIPVAERFQALYRALSTQDSTLEQDERFQQFAGAVLPLAANRLLRDPSNVALGRARDYIAAHASDRVGLFEVAAHAELSPWHFARTFRRRFGMPPHQFQLWMRIDRARRLLASGTGIAEAAHRTGFADQSHFTRCFKRMMRTTPARYRHNRRRTWLT